MCVYVCVVCVLCVCCVCVHMCDCIAAYLNCAVYFIACGSKMFFQLEYVQSEPGFVLCVHTCVWMCMCVCVCACVCVDVSPWSTCHSLSCSGSLQRHKGISA